MLQNNLSTEAELLKLSIQQMFLEWATSQPQRSGLHAASLLIQESEWCTRKHVLLNLFPGQAEQPELKPWDWKTQERFLHGWEIHRMIQHIFTRFGRVVWSPVSQEQANHIIETTPPALLHYFIRLTTDGWEAAELDLTHYDETREVNFSPDAILDFGPNRYVCEIKGLKQESFEKLTDDLETACSVNETVATATRQANLYMHLTGVKKAIILIWNKNVPDFKLWVIEYDADMVRPQIGRIYMVKKGTVIAIKHNKLPQRVCQSASDPLAKKCAMRKVCFREEDV